MLPNDYCRAKAAPAGSDLHYSLLSLNSPQRDALTALYALNQELFDINRRSHEPGIAERKLAWWQEEIKRLFNAKAQHPATQALAQSCQLSSLSSAAFQERLEAAQMDLNYNAYPGFEQLLQYAHHAGSSITLLHSEILGDQQPETRDFAHQWGIALLLLQRLCTVREDAQRGYFYIPETELRQFAVDYDDLLQTQTSPSLQNLFQHQAQRIRDFCQRALAVLPDSERYTQCSQLIRLQLALKLLDEIENSGFQLLQQQIRLTPLRKLWIAWRTLRHERRRQRSATLRMMESKSI